MIEGKKISDATRRHGIEFHIECETVLFAPDLAVEDPPVAGTSLRMIQRFQSCDLMDWIGKQWIWFFRPLARPNSHSITLMQDWRDFAPMENLAEVVYLVDELAQKNPQNN